MVGRLSIVQLGQPYVTVLTGADTAPGVNQS